MRVPNDRLVCQQTSSIDLFLGGHDHIYHHEKVGQNIFIKSGSDFKQLSLLEISFRSPTPIELSETPHEKINDKNVENLKGYSYYIRDKFTLKVTKFDIDKSIQPIKEITAYIDECYRELDERLKEVVCHLDQDLDTTFLVVRTQECPIGNFIADLMKKEQNSDCAMVHGGTIRADKVYSKGLMTLGNWNEIIPFHVNVAQLEATGKQILECLENSVSKLPALEGRFLHVERVYPKVSNIWFSFDERKREGERVVEGSVRIGNEPIDLDRTYRISVPDYLSKGKDGFGCLLDAKVIIDPFLGPELKNVILDFLDLTNTEEAREEVDLVKRNPEIFNFEAISESSLKKRASNEQKRSIFGRVNPPSVCSKEETGINSPRLNIHSHGSQNEKGENPHFVATSEVNVSRPGEDTINKHKKDGKHVVKVRSELSVNNILKDTEQKEVLSGKADSNCSSEEENDLFDAELELLPELSLKKTRSVIKLRNNNILQIQSAFEGNEEVEVGSSLLKRLRQYRLIASTIYYEGRAIVGISPTVENRIVKVQ